MNSQELNGRQKQEGQDGHFNACWTHEITKQDAEAIRSGGWEPAGEGYGVERGLWCASGHIHQPVGVQTSENLAGTFLVKVIHGNHDLVAMPRYGAQLAKKLGGYIVWANGGHFIPRENVIQVGRAVKSWGRLMRPA
jgi:hypothetical protein